MLESLRRASKSWVIKILFGLLIVSFVVFFGNSTELSQLSISRPAIVVGSRDISGEALSNQFRRDVEGWQSRLQTPLSPERAREMGLLNQTIQQMINRELINEAASGLKLTLDDDSLRRMIYRTPAFQNDLGAFDKDIYAQLLRRAGFTEAEFLRMSREDSVRQDLMRALMSGVSFPEIGVDMLFERRSERRVAEVVLIPSSAMPTPAIPDDATLKAYWEANPALFTAPESRGFTALVLSIEDLSKTIVPSPEEIKQSFEARQGEFSMPERRHVHQLVFSGQEEADAFARDLAATKDIEKFIREKGKESVDLGVVAKAEIPDPALADAAFLSPTVGALPAPVKTAFGWHVLWVDAIEPARAKPLEDVKDVIVAQLVKDQATNQLFDLSTKLEDAIGSGASLEEAADSVGIKLLKVEAVTVQGRTPDGAMIDNLPASGSFGASLFQTPEGSTSPVVEMENQSGYFVLRTDKVTPQAIRPFETSKAIVLDIWAQEQKRKAAQDLAHSLSERLAKGESLEAIAKGRESETTEPFLRSANAQTSGLPPQFVEGMFGLSKPGEATVIDLGELLVAARLKTIIAADKETDLDTFAALQEELNEALAADIQQQFLAAIREQIGVTINQPIIARQFETQR